MGLIHEPSDVDFIFDPRPLTQDESKLISSYIKADKDKLKMVKTVPKKNQIYPTSSLISHVPRLLGIYKMMANAAAVLTTLIFDCKPRLSN